MIARVVASLLVFASLVAVDGRADAAWTPTPVTLSAAGLSAVDPVTAVGPNGHAAFVWRRQDTAGDWRVQLRVRSSTGTLGAVQTVSNAGDSAYSPDVAIDATGRVVVVWSQRADATGIYTVQAKIRTAAGQLSALKNLSTGVGVGSALRSPDPQVELDPSDAAVVAWQTVFASASYRAVTRSISPSGVVAASWQTLSADGLNLRPVALGVDDSGVAIVAWSRDNGVDTRVEARTRASDGTLGAIKILSPAGQDSTAPAVAVTPDGRRVVAWVRYDTADTALYARQISAAGVLGTVRKLSGTDKNVDDSTTTAWGEAAISDSGDAVFAWQQDRPCCSKEVAVRGLTAAGTLSPIAVAGTAYAYQPQVVVDPTGQATLSFAQRDGAFDDRITVRTRSSAGVLGAVQTLSVAGQDANHPDLAINDAGLAAVTWVRSDGSDGSFCCDRAQFSIGP